MRGLLLAPYVGGQLRKAAIRLAFLLLCVAHLTARADDNPFARGFDAVPVKPTAAQDSGIALEGARR